MAKTNAWVARVGTWMLLVGSMVVAMTDAGHGRAAVADGSKGSEISLQGFAEVGAPLLPLPLALGTEATIDISFGAPPVTLSIHLTSGTVVKAEGGLPIVLVDGDRIKVEVEIIGGLLHARRLEIDDFPELRLMGTLAGLPPAGVALPLLAGALPVDATIALGASGPSVPIRFTARTRVKGGPVIIDNGDVAEVKAIVREGRIVVTRLETEREHGPGDD